MHSMDTTDNFNQPQPENTMKNRDCIAAPLLVLGLLVSAGAAANEYPHHDLTQQLAQNMGAEERAALREQLGNRMRDSAYDGRKRMESDEAAGPERRGGRNEGGYGRGHESRQGGSMGGGGGGGRGMGGGRGR